MKGKKIFAVIDTSFGLYTDRTDWGKAFFPDRDDIVFYEIAMSVKDSYLVTGNIKHFPKKCFVVTPAQMMDILRQQTMQ